MGCQSILFAVLFSAAAALVLLLFSRYLLLGKEQPPMLTSTLSHHLVPTASDMEETKALLRASIPRLAALADADEKMAETVEQLSQSLAALQVGSQQQALRALKAFLAADEQQRNVTNSNTSRSNCNVTVEPNVTEVPSAKWQCNASACSFRKCNASDCNFHGVPSGIRGFCECECEVGFCGFACEMPCSTAPPPEGQIISVSNYGSAFPLLELPPEGASIDAFEYVQEPVVYELAYYLDHTQPSGLPVTVSMPVAMRVRDRSIVDAADPYMAHVGHRVGRKERVETVNRLREMNETMPNVWRAPIDKCLFFISDQLSRFIGHYNPPFLTQLGKFLETFRNQSNQSNFVLVIHDHSDLNRHVPGRVSPVQATVYWILRLLNLNVTLLPHYTPVLSNCSLFTRDVGAPLALFTAHGDRLMRTIWTRVRELYKDYPIYKRVAIIKGKANTVSPERGFVLCECFLKRLRDNGFFVITADTPMAERMWYINHAERLLVSWGAIGEVILPLRVVDREKLNFVQLFHSVYRKNNELGDPPVTARVPGRYTEYARSFSTKFPYSDRPLRVWEVEDDDLERLTDHDLCCA